MLRRIRLLAATASVVCGAVSCLIGKAQTEASETYIADEYQEICVAAGEEYGICPELLMAIIERESSGNPDAENGHCKGLCQLNDKYFDGDLFNPETNIYMAAEYLQDLAEKYEDIGLVLMKYHGERDAVEKSERGELSKYAKGILTRSEELEEIHGKIQMVAGESGSFDESIDDYEAWNLSSDALERTVLGGQSEMSEDETGRSKSIYAVRKVRRLKYGIQMR